MAIWSNISARVAVEHGGRGPKRRPAKSDTVAAIGLAVFTVAFVAVIVVANLT